MGAFALCAFCFGVVLMCAASGSAQPVGDGNDLARGQSVRVRADGVAAVVGGRAAGPGVDVLLRSDVEFRARLELSKDPTVIPGASEPDAAMLRASMNGLLGEMLIAREAERVRIATPSSADIAREKTRIIAAVGGEERLLQLLVASGAQMGEVDVFAARAATVSAFLSANLEGTTDITDAQLQREYDQGDHPYVGEPLDSVREPLRSWLARRALDRVVARWVTVLRTRTEMAVFASY